MVVVIPPGRQFYLWRAVDSEPSQKASVDFRRVGFDNPAGIARGGRFRAECVKLFRRSTGYDRARLRRLSTWA